MQALGYDREQCGIGVKDCIKQTPWVSMQSSRSNEQCIYAQRDTCFDLRGTNCFSPNEGWRVSYHLFIVDHQVTWESCMDQFPRDTIYWMIWCHTVVLHDKKDNTQLPAPGAGFRSGYCFHYKLSDFSRSGSYNLCYFYGLGHESNHKENTAWLKTFSLSWQNFFFSFLIISLFMIIILEPLLPFLWFCNIVQKGLNSFQFSHHC